MCWGANWVLTRLGCLRSLSEIFIQMSPFGQGDVLMSATPSVVLLLVRLLLIRGKRKEKQFLPRSYALAISLPSHPYISKREEGQEKKGNCTSHIQAIASATFSQDRLVPIPEEGRACFSTAFSHLPVYLSPASKSFTAFLRQRNWSFPSHF